SLEIGPPCLQFHISLSIMGNKEIAMFNGIGFHTWQVKLKGHLMRKGLWSIITTDAQNLTAQQIRERQAKDEKALGILITSVADDIIHHLDEATSAKQAWETLERTFGAKSKHSKISLKMQLYGLAMYENETLSSLVNRLKSLCTQLSYIECHIDDDDKVAVLLKALPSTYDNIVTVLKEKEPIPTLESVINSLQEDHNNKHPHNETNASKALYVSSSKHTKACKHCGKYNHLSSECYKIKKCVKCGKLGHPPQFCTKGNGGNGDNGGKKVTFKGKRVNYVQSESDDSDDEDQRAHSDNDEVNMVTSAF
ncbi:hypothetical protein GOP47_0024089, partial [Adiantum capillus-veneris]